MNNIAFFIGDTCVTWHGILAGFGALAAIISSLMLRLMQRRRLLPVLYADVFAAITVPLLSRAVYCHAVTERTGEAVRLFFSDTAGGSIAGALCGLMLAGSAAHFATKRGSAGQSAGELFDCLLPSGVIGVAVGRLAGLFDASDKGKVTVENAAFRKLPFSVPVADAFTGELRYHLAVFLYEAAAAYVIFILSMIIFRSVYGSSKRGYAPSSAGICALAFFAASQCVFDSMKYDSLVMHINGFVSLTQILCLFVLLGCIAFAARRSARRGGPYGGKKTALKTAACVLLTAAAGLMEYLVQRRIDLYFLSYPVMLAALCGTGALTVSMLRGPTANAAPERP